VYICREEESHMCIMKAFVTFIEDMKCLASALQEAFAGCLPWESS
jgi:hypothetical protein